MPVLNLTPAEVRRRRRFVIILVEMVGVAASIFNFMLMRQVVTTLSFNFVLGVCVFTFLFLQAILFLTLHLIVGPNRPVE